MSVARKPAVPIATREGVMRLRVLLADDHQLIRQALRALLERQGFDVVAEASDGRAAVDLAGEVRPDVAVLDVAMPVLNGVDAARDIGQASPDTRVILLTALNDAQFVSTALHVGVRGFVLKLQDIDDLTNAIRQVSAGGLYVSPGLSQAVLDAVHAAAGQIAAPLSPRERQVVQLVAQGKSTKQIAELLEISVKTAEFHRGRVMEKLNIHDTAGLVRYAIREGLILP
jgi:DNA-binding NarL/FixJ family response regulator